MKEKGSAGTPARLASHGGVIENQLSAWPLPRSGTPPEDFGWSESRCRVPPEDFGWQVPKCRVLPEDFGWQVS
jgi:hypothetical protein